MSNFSKIIFYLTFLCIVIFVSKSSVSCNLQPIENIIADAIAVEKILWHEINRYSYKTDQIRQMLLRKVQNYYFKLIFSDNPLLLSNWTSEAFSIFKDNGEFHSKATDLSKTSDKFIEFLALLQKVNNPNIQEVFEDMKMYADEIIIFFKDLPEIFSSQKFVYDKMESVSIFLKL